MFEKGVRDPTLRFKKRGGKDEIIVQTESGQIKHADNLLFEDDLKFGKAPTLAFSDLDKLYIL